MATIAAALIAGGATYYASRQANKRSAAERKAGELMNQNAGIAGQYGQDMLGRSKEALDPVYDYYRKLATGDRETLGQYLAPEIAAQSDASRRAFQTSSELSPRSGISTEATSRIPMDNAAVIARLIGGGRAAGMQGLGTLGTNMASLGMQGLGQGTAGAGQILNYEGDRRRDQRSAGENAGMSAYEIFKLFSNMQNGKQGGQQGNAFWNNASRTYGAGGSATGGSLW